MTTELRQLLDSAADDTPPVDLAHRAVDGARRRRQQRFAVVGAVAAATALVAGAVVLGPLQQSADEPRPQDVASLPAELPGPSGLPELTAGAMAAASTAYVIDDRLVLMDASSEEGAVWNGITELTGVDTGGLDAGALRPYQVRLSPDGTTALVAMRFESSQRLLGIRLAVLDVATAEFSLEDLQLSDANAESAWLEYNLMAWGPDSSAFYCVCMTGDDNVPRVYRVTFGIDILGMLYTNVKVESDLAPAQISAGAAGLAAQLTPNGDWSLVRPNGSVGQSKGTATLLSLSWDDARAYARVRDDTFAKETAGAVHFVSLQAGPVSSLHARGSDFVLVSWPTDAAPGEPPPPQPLFAHLLTQDDEPQLLTTFPAGTKSTSFAADVDTVQ